MILFYVEVERLELSRLTAPDPKSGVSTIPPHSDKNIQMISVVTFVGTPMDSSLHPLERKFLIYIYTPWFHSIYETIL